MFRRLTDVCAQSQSFSSLWSHTSESSRSFYNDWPILTIDGSTSSSSWSCSTSLPDDSVMAWCISREIGRFCKAKLSAMPPFTLETQTKVIVSCMTLHNFIRRHNITDAEFEVFNDNFEFENEEILDEKNQMKRTLGKWNILKSK